ncbi:hypothetical protein ABK040_005191 [Willaertia magna]
MVWCTTCRSDISPVQTTEGLYCGQCGEELGEHFDESVEFNADNTAVGTFVSSERALAQTASAFGSIPQFTYDEEGNLVFTSAVPSTSDLNTNNQPMTESRLQTISRARRRIIGIATLMKISSHYIDRATNTFKLALQKGFTKARNPDIVAAACLYFVLRQDKQPYMLMDFSEALKTDVFQIGHTFLNLMESLHFKLPMVEPFFYVRRFANRLNFGEQDVINKIIQTTCKLIANMKRNWIQTGRRPAGICAAALLIASRIHNCPRSKEEVVKVVKICTSTLTKRLMEFDQTDTAKLTLEEFEKQENEIIQGTFTGTVHVIDPPAFTRSLNTKMKITEMMDDRNLDKNVQNEEDEFDKEFREKKDKYELKLKKEREKWLLQQQLEENNENTNNNAINEKDIEDVEQLLENDKQIQEITKEMDQGDLFMKEQQKKQSLSQSILGSQLSIDQSQRDSSFLNNQNNNEEELFDEEEEYLNNNTLNTNIEEEKKGEEEEDKGITETLSDFSDDSEIDEYIVNDPIEVEHREKLWDELNSEYLELMEQKRKEKEEKKKRGGGRGRKKNQNNNQLLNGNMNGGIGGNIFDNIGMNMGSVNGGGVNNNYRSASEASANMLKARIAKGLVSSSLFDEDDLFGDSIVDNHSIQASMDGYKEVDNEDNVIGKRPISLQERNRLNAEYNSDGGGDDDFDFEDEPSYKKRR